MANQPIPFKEHSSKDAEADEAGKPRPGLPRPPGEVGGHTVQSWEQDAVLPTTSPNSKDVPPPEEGAKEAKPAQPTAAPRGAGAAATRPPRPPATAPQAGHAPAPRPPPSRQPAAADDAATAGDALVEALTRAIAENLAKALHQSIAQAVRDAMPLSGRSVDQGTPGTPAPADLPVGRTGADPPVARAGPLAKPQAMQGPPGRTPTETMQPAASRPAHQLGTPATPAATAPAVPPATAPMGGAPPEAGEQPSQFGGTIEAPDDTAAPKAKDET